MMSMVDILLKENADLQAGYDAARLEIESLQARIAERDAQEYAIGAGGMEPLRKRCLHQISEPAQAQPAAQALDSVRVFWQQHTQADALSMMMAELHNDVELVIRAARGAAQAAPVDAATWQPIASAPKDGRAILLRSKKGRIADGLWSAANSSTGFWAWAYVRQEPVEWMPEPGSPAARAREQQP